MSPSTPTTSLSIEPRPKFLTRRLKSLQHDMLQPKMGEHMEYDGNVTQESNEHNKCYHYMHIWLVESSMVTIFA